MNAGIVVVIAVVIIAVGFGIYRRATDGRVRQTDGGTSQWRPDGGDGIAATIVQFSSEFCAPCRRTKALVENTIRDRSDIAYLDVDVAERTDLTAQFDVFRTPTVIIFDDSGRPRFRASGALRDTELTDALTQITSAKERVS